MCPFRFSRHLMCYFSSMKQIQLTINGRNINAFYYSKDSKKRPGVLFLHDLTGIQKANHKACEILMDEGYHVLLPDLYSELGKQKYCVRAFFNEYARNNSAMNNEPLNEVLEIIDTFKNFHEVDKENLGMIGQCLTGGFVLHAAIRPEMKAPVVFHHSLGVKGSGMPPSCAPLVQNKIQGHFVYLDAFCSQNKVKALEEQLGNKLEKHYYALPHGIPHLFFNTKQGEKAFGRMLSFMRKQLVAG